jgi:hypothetical protein
MNLHKTDFVGGLLAGLVTGLGIGLLLAPQQGRALVAWQRSETGRRVSETLGEAGPLIFELGLVMLAQVRPVLGRLAWALVSLAGRNRSR